MNQTQRNDPCPCGSGKKFKKCCINRQKGSILSGIFSSKKKFVYLALIAIFFLSIFLRYYGFNQPHGLTFDEGLYAHRLAPQLQDDPTNYSSQAAYQQIVTQTGRPLPKYLDRPLFKHPPLYCYLIALNYGIFGRSELVAVSVSIILGSLMVLVAFFFGKFLYDERVGLLAAAFLCIEPVHWVCSERIWMETTLSFFMFLGVFLFALGRKHKFCLVLSGLSLGLALFTKYPAVLTLFIIISFILLFDRPMLKEKNFWALCSLAFLIFLPWVIWNWKVFGNLSDALFSVHNLGHRIKWAWRLLLDNKGISFISLSFVGFVLLMRNKIKVFFGNSAAEQQKPEKKYFIAGAYLLVGIFVFVFVPFSREMIKEAFIFPDTVLVGWANPFLVMPRYFYLTRLSELSPLYIFSFLSIFLFFGNNKGDKLLILSSLWILISFILWRNFQSRYILPVVPFMVILSARWQVWAYDKLSGLKTSRVIFRFFLVGLSVYFFIKTLKVDSLIAIGPDFGYF